VAGGQDVLTHHVEVVVKSRDFVDLGLCQAHFLRQCRQVRRSELAVVVVDQVQMLDQQIGLARCIAQQLLHFGERLGVHPAALGGFALALLGRRNGENWDDDLVHDCLISASIQTARACRAAMWVRQVT
jgi:hypothetical protein